MARLEAILPRPSPNIPKLLSSLPAPQLEMTTLVFYASSEENALLLSSHSFVR